MIEHVWQVFRRFSTDLRRQPSQRRYLLRCRIADCRRLGWLASSTYGGWSVGVGCSVPLPTGELRLWKIPPTVSSLMN